MWAAPGLAATALLSLTLGVGGVTVVFSALDGALLRPPPFADASRLAILYITHAQPEHGAWRERWSYPRYQLLRRLPTPFTDIASFSSAEVTLTGVDEPAPAHAEVVSPSYFSVLRVSPSAGRTFLASEDSAPGAHRVVVLGHALWERRFGGDPAIVGRTIGVNGVALTVVGVAPRGFLGLSERAELWIPTSLAPFITYDGYRTTNQNFISVVARLRSGVPMARAQSAMAALEPRIQGLLPSEAEGARDTFGATAVALNAARVDPGARGVLLLLFGAAAFVLLLACVNVASLLLGRAMRRRREIATRLALGATRRDIVRQLLAESAVLAAMGGGLGVLVAVAASPVAALPARLARGANQYGSIGMFAEPSLNLRVLLFALGATVVTTLAFGLLPALRASRTDLAAAMQSGGRGQVSEGAVRRQPSLRGALVAAEIALTFALLAGGSLMLRSYHRMRTAAIGFSPDHLLTFVLRPSEVRYDPVHAPALIHRVLLEIDAVPGVVGSTVDGCAPLGTRCANTTLYVVGRPVPAPDAAPEVLRHYVAPDHFRVLGVPLLRGRVFTSADRAGSQRVAIINETAARRFWPQEDPIGRRVWFGGGSGFDRPDSAAKIVGIVGDVAYQPLDEHPVQADFYTPYAQFTYATRTVIVRAAGDPTALVPLIRRAIQRADPDLALRDVQTMAQRAAASRATPRYETTLLGVLAAVALILAATGVYAVVAHTVGARRREIAVRIALGARPAAVVRAVGRETIVLGAAGMAVGIGAALALTQVLAALLYGTSPLEPAAYAGAAVVLVVVIICASVIPARGAARVDPAEVLREE